VKTETIVSIQGPLGTPLEIIKQTFPAFQGSPTKRCSFVTGLHGDELEGLYLCHRLIRFLRDLQESRPEAFLGDIHIYPAVNPPALNSATRPWPFYEQDLNRTLGDSKGRSIPVQIAQKLLDDISTHSDLVVDIHSSNLYLRELPQIRIIEEFAKKLVPLAQATHTDLIWVHPMAGLFESTLGYNLNRRKIPTLVIEAGICLRVHRPFGDRMFEGMLNLLKATGILAEDTPGLPDPTPKTRVVNPTEVVLNSAKESGLFVAQAQLGDRLMAGEPIGQVLDAVTGETLEQIVAPGNGLLFTLREHPLAYAGALLARIALDEEPQP